MAGEVERLPRLLLFIRLTQKPAGGWQGLEVGGALGGVVYSTVCGGFGDDGATQALQAESKRWGIFELCATG